MRTVSRVSSSTGQREQLAAAEAIDGLALGGLALADEHVAGLEVDHVALQLLLASTSEIFLLRASVMIRISSWMLRFIRSISPSSIDLARMSLSTPLREKIFTSTTGALRCPEAS
jgi:hypothetical protein